MLDRWLRRLIDGRPGRMVDRRLRRRMRSYRIAVLVAGLVRAAAVSGRSAVARTVVSAAMTAVAAVILSAMAERATLLLGRRRGSSGSGNRPAGDHCVCQRARAAGSDSRALSAATSTIDATRILDVQDQPETQRMTSADG